MGVSVLLVAILVIVIVVATADDDGKRSEALETFGATHDLCVSTEGKRDTFSEGLDVFWNVGPGPVTINDVSWSDNDGLELVDVRIIERGKGSRFAMYGVHNDYPPVDRPWIHEEYKAWRDSVPAVGAELPETGKDDQHYYNVVVGLRGEAGQAGPLRIEYTDADGDHGVLETLVTVRVTRIC